MLAEKSKSKRKILIVDDNELNLKMLENILFNAGYAVIQTNNGKDAILKTREEQPDLVILDITMPGLDGIDVGVILKADPRTKDIPIIFLSSLMTIDERTEKRAILGSRFLPKPIDRETLLKEVASYF